MRRRFRLIRLAVVLLLIVTSPAAGTKPCPPSPCLLENGTLDRARCTDLAAWVAVGTIENVVHHEAGPPLLKDFAEFTFRARKWEKGSGHDGQRIRFRVGWCQNAQALPKDTSGAFRFFGLPLPKDSPRRNTSLSRDSRARARGDFAPFLLVRTGRDGRRS